MVWFNANKRSNSHYLKYLMHALQMNHQKNSPAHTMHHPLKNPRLKKTTMCYVCTRQVFACSCVLLIISRERQKRTGKGETKLFPSLSWATLLWLCKTLLERCLGTASRFPPSSSPWSPECADKNKSTPPPSNRHRSKTRCHPRLHRGW